MQKFVTNLPLPRALHHAVKIDPEEYDTARIFRSIIHDFFWDANLRVGRWERSTRRRFDCQIVAIDAYGDGFIE
jgi:hypothetical protein